MDADGVVVIGSDSADVEVAAKLTTTESANTAPTCFRLTAIVSFVLCV